MQHYFVSLISGFALLGVLLNSLQSAFSDSSYRYSILISFIVAVANIAFIGIASPVWSLLVGGASVRFFGEGKVNDENLNKRQI